MARLFGVAAKARQRTDLGWEPVQYQGHLPRPAPAAEWVEWNVQQAGCDWMRRCGHSPRAWPAGFTHLCVFHAPFLISPLCWRMRRRGFTVNLPKKRGRCGGGWMGLGGMEVGVARKPQRWVSTPPQPHSSHPLPFTLPTRCRYALCAWGTGWRAGSNRRTRASWLGPYIFMLFFLWAIVKMLQLAAH